VVSKLSELEPKERTTSWVLVLGDDLRDLHGRRLGGGPAQQLGERVLSSKGPLDQRNKLWVGRADRADRNVAAAELYESGLSKCQG
jgi:hypothetical protein